MKVRKLIFSDLDSVQKELLYLKGKNVLTHGDWNFYQILTHLSDGLEFTLESKKTMTDPLPEIIQNTIGKLILHYILFFGFPPGLPNPVREVPLTQEDSTVALEKLLIFLEKFKNATENFSTHPIFGILDKSEWTKLHCNHFAHHLGFVSVIA